MENKRVRSQLFNLAYSSITLPYLGKVDECASIMLRLCHQSRKTWRQNLKCFLKIISERACLNLNDLLSTECFDALVNVPPIYFDFDVCLQCYDKCKKFYEFIIIVSQMKKAGNIHYQQLSFKHNLVIGGLNKRKYQCLIQTLIKEFDISYYLFRELNNDANEFVNLFENSLLKEKKTKHGLFYIRMVNLANYEYFARGRTSATNQEAHFLNSICFSPPSTSLSRLKRESEGKIRSSFKNKFYRVGYLSISEASVPHQFIKHAFKNLISYVNCIKISPYPFLEQIEGISKSIQHHCQELEIISYSVELPRGNYLRNVLQKFPHILTFSLDTSSDILIEELLRLLPVDDVHNYIEKSRDAVKFKAIFEKSQRLISLPDSLCNFKFKSNHKGGVNSLNSDPNKIELGACEADFVIRKGALCELYTVRADNFCFNYTHKSITVIQKQNGVLQDTLLINDCLSFILSGYCVLVNYRASIVEDQYFEARIQKPLFQIRIKTKDIVKFSSLLVVDPPQLTSPLIDHLKQIQSLISPNRVHLSIRLSKLQNDMTEGEDCTQSNSDSVLLNSAELNLSEIEFESIDISEFNLPLDEFNVLIKQVSSQKRIRSVNLAIESLDQFNVFLEAFKHNTNIEYFYIKVNDVSISINIKCGLRKFASKKIWINKIQVNQTIVFYKALTNKIYC